MESLTILLVPMMAIVAMMYRALMNTQKRVVAIERKLDTIMKAMELDYSDAVRLQEACERISALYMAGKHKAAKELAKRELQTPAEVRAAWQRVQSMQTQAQPETTGASGTAGVSPDQ